jgi:hypothetical protein
MVNGDEKINANLKVPQNGIFEANPISKRDYISGSLRSYHILHNIYIIMYIYIYRDTYINMCLNHLEPLLPRALNFQHTSGHVDLVLVDLNKFLESRSRAALLVSAMAIQCSGAHELCRVVLI